MLSSLKAYEITKIGQNRGSPRLWLQGLRAQLAGFLPGKRFNVRKDESRSMLILELDEAGIRLVSKKSRASGDVPVIDVNSKELLSVFEGLDSVRVIVQSKRIVVLPLQADLAQRERLGRLIDKLRSSEPLKLGSVAHGGGVLSHAVHHGLRDAGIANQLAFANEIRSELLDQSALHDSAWHEETVALAAPLQHLAFDPWAMERLEKCEILSAGLPCSGASVAGRAKRGLTHPEAHPDIGHLILPFLTLVARVQPCIVLCENVKSWGTSASMHILRNFLRDFAYDVHEVELHAEEWNALEHRVRLCVVAVTRGLKFDFSMLRRPGRQVRTIAEILDPIGPDDPRWSRMQGLKEKETRDAAAGKCFKMQLVSSNDTSCPTITKGYSKVRSTDPKLRHPTNPDLLRQFTSAEHARLKGVSPELVFGLSETIAHEVLGQSICYEPFRAVANSIGHMLKSMGKAMSPAPVAIA